MKTQIVKHGFLLVKSAFDRLEALLRQAVRQFLILETLPIAATAEFYYLVYVVRRNIAATNIAKVIVSSVEGTNNLILHGDLIS
jgi:hypothetical protein